MTRKVCAFVVLTFLALCDSGWSQASMSRMQELDQNIKMVYEQLSNDPKTMNQQLAILYFNKGVVAYEDLQSTSKAMAYVRKAISFDPQMHQAYEFLGDLQYLSQQMKQARASYLRAYQINRDPRLKQKMGQLKKEFTVEKDMKKYGSSRFIIRYANGDRDYEGYQIRQILDEAYRKVGRDFQFYPTNKITVLLYGKENYTQFKHGLQWSAGVYDGKIRLSEDATKSVQDLRALAYHEYTHALVQSLVGYAVPTWLHEGLAENQEAKIQKPDLSLLQQAKVQGQLIPVETLLRVSPGQLGSNAAIALYYQQSYSIIHYLTKKYGWSKVRKILLSMKSGKGFEQAMFDVLRLTPKTLEKKWVGSL